MQIKSLRIRSYRSFKVNDTTPAHALERLRRFEMYRELRAEGCSETTALRAVGCSRSTFFRWLKRYNTQGVRGLANRSRRPRHTRRPRWSRGEERRVWAMRARFPFMGKRRLRVMLAREGHKFSESTLGRILAKGVRLGRIQPCAFCRGRLKVKRRRGFNGHAQRWRYGQRAQRPGELVQIDHLSLPPRRPQFNGCVERANDSTRVEFWNLYQGHFTVADANRALADYQHFHNQVRPHQALDYKTPNEYLQSTKDCTNQSHM